MSLALVQTSRRLNSWVTAFLEFTENLQSPDIFRKWAAISAIGAALEQRVWIKTMGTKLFPNLFVGLVGPPGSGKTLAISAISSLYRELKDFHVSPSSMSCAALTDVLNESKRRIVRPLENPPYSEFNSLYIVSRELGVLLPAYDPEMMSTLNEIYDCGPYRQRRRGNSINFEIPDAQISILTATTPSFLTGFLPEGAWSQGFTSRNIFVYSGSAEPKDIFNDPEGDPDLRRSLIDDLKIISNYFGKLEFSEEAARVIRDWHLDRTKPIPDHPRLMDYVSRRTQHVLKLSMVSAVARRTAGMTIEVEDFQTALNWLTEAEEFIPDIFRTEHPGGNSAIVDETWYFVWHSYTKERKPVIEPRVIQFVHERTATHNVMKILDLMIRSNLLIRETDPSGAFYKPGVKEKK